MLNLIQTLILDLDGTVYLDGKPIKNIVEDLNFFKQKGNDIFYLSNNTSLSKQTYLEKLKNLNLTVDFDDIITPTTIAGAYLSKKYSKGFFLGTKDFSNELYDFYNISYDENNPEFVLIAFDKELTYCKLELACKFINKGTPFYITHIDIACPTINGPMPDCGSISKLIEIVTNKKPICDFGKPSMKMVDFINKKIKSHDKTLMVGDRIYTDMVIGEKLGVKNLLVFSGESKLEDFKENKNIRIDFCSETLSDFINE
jgi:HAD superfamily hydrolase (TIGR01450 family)